jgi:hypothetical protein
MPTDTLFFLQAVRSAQRRFRRRLRRGALGRGRSTDRGGGISLSESYDRWWTEAPLLEQPRERYVPILEQSTKTSVLKFRAAKKEVHLTLEQLRQTSVTFIATSSSLGPLSWTVVLLKGP